MKRVASLVLAALAGSGLSAQAKTFIHDDAGMLSAGAISQLDTRIGNFNAQTGKEIVVQTVPSVSGGDVKAAAESAFSQLQVNGVLIFVDKGDRKDWILPDNAAVRAGWWTSQTSTSIAGAMEAQFRAGDFDGGITAAVNGALNVYRSHLGSLPNANGAQPAVANGGTYTRHSSTGGISVFWWIVIAFVGFLILRSIMRAASGPRYYGNAPPPGTGAGYGGGYGPGYGWGGGGGGFWSGLLGGLGGAWLGNEMFGRGGMGGGAWGNVDPTAGGGAPSDGGGWTSDAGQAGLGGGGGGDWSGGGFGGGDFGGGGGGFGGGDGGGGGSW